MWLLLPLGVLTHLSGPTPLLTLFAFAGRAVIVTGLNLLLLQISLEAGQVCVQSPDVFVHLGARKERESYKAGSGKRK